MVKGGPSVAARFRQAGDAGLAAAIVGGVALALYIRTLLPDVGLWDTAEFQAVGPVLGIAHPTGYPSYTLLLCWLRWSCSRSANRHCAPTCFLRSASRSVARCWPA